MRHAMRSPLLTIQPLWQRGVALLEWLQAPALLAARLFVAKVFVLAGLTKIRKWDITLALFDDEYHVPLLNPDFAAYLATAGELVLPVLLVLGLGGRFAALGLSILNVVAVLSLAEVPEAAMTEHLFWGSLLAVVALWGPGRWSIDHWMMAPMRRSTRAAALRATSR